MIFVQMSSLAKAIIHKCLPKARYSNVFSLGFSVLSFLLFTSALITGCGSSKHIQTIPVETIKEIYLHDTLVVRDIQYDSTYVSHDLLTDRSRDTLLIRETNTIYKYKMLRDTIERIKLEVRHDSIPHEVRITEVKQVKYIPPWIKPLALIGIISLLALLIYIFTKLKHF